jgi:hypothetical protein
MSNTLNIPAEAIPAVQEALFVLMSEAAEGLTQALSSPDRERNPDWFVDDRRRLEHACALLDTLGWDVDVVASESVEIDLGRHGADLCEAIESYLPLLETQEEEAEASDKWRAERGKPARKEQIVREVALLRELVAVLGQGSGDSD